MTRPNHPYLTGVEVAKVCGLSYRQVDYYVRRGAVTPTVDAKGSGRDRGFTLDDAVVLYLAANLRAASGGNGSSDRWPVVFSTLRDRVSRGTLASTIEVVEGIRVTVSFANIRSLLAARWPEGRTMMDRRKAPR